MIKMIGKIGLLLNRVKEPIRMVKVNVFNQTNVLVIIFLIMLFLISAIISILISKFTKRKTIKKIFKEKIEELDNLYEKKEYKYKIFSKTKDTEKYKISQARVVVKQETLREDIIKLVNKNKFLKKMQVKEAEKLAKKTLRKRTTREEKGVHGLWLLGLPIEKAKEIFKEIKNNLVKEIEEFLEEKGEEETKRKLIREDGFKKRNAEKIIEECKRRKEN